MKVELIKQEGNKVSFKLTVDHDKFESAVVKAYNKNIIVSPHKFCGN